jgi:hypothetical protein
MSNETAPPRLLDWATFRELLPDIARESFLPLDDEAVRTYEWPLGNEVYFEDPVAVAVLEDGSHLVVSNEGELVTIPTPHRNNIIIKIEAHEERGALPALGWLQTLKFADPWAESE